MSDIKQVKVDNWGIYFLQRLKHFFNRTDYCDLTLQFQDNAQLKVHRLVLSACTEYFELLERTCEMYEDCLVMPDDLQADVVVPIVNFMYTGQLEFKMELLESLYQTSLIMNMPVLTKLLDAHRSETVKPLLNYASTKRSYSKSSPSIKPKQTPVPSSSGVSKRSYSNAFGISTASISYGSSREKKQYPQEPIPNHIRITPPKASPVFNPRLALKDPRPTRYELPEDLDNDNIFEDSFSNISYASQPLMVHPETSKQYPSNRYIFDEASGSKRIGRTTTMDIVECKKVIKSNNIFEDDDLNCMSENADYEPPSDNSVKNEVKVSNHLFDEILDSSESTGPKVSIETKNSKQAAGIDHAKIISEVLKKYPHLVKTNKNIKLKILNSPSPKVSAPSPPIKSQTRRRKPSPTPYTDEKVKQEKPDYTYETDVLDSKEAARLIALGAENINGPWICLICGTPGKALHFTSYYKFRRHLVEVHNEKPASKICEYCGLKSLKRNYLLHHLYTKHGVEPPPQYNFPKCNMCNYVALTEAFLIKHKLSHTRNFRCNVCASAYSTSSELLVHIQSTGHKYTADRKNNLQCIYCLKVFLRETNLFTHLKTNHKKAAIVDGIIEESDDDEKDVKPSFMKYELPVPYDKVQEENTESQFQIQQSADGNIKLVPTKQHAVATTPTKKQKILNIGLHVPTRKPSPSKPKPTRTESNAEFEFTAEVSSNNNPLEEIVMIDNNEYVMRNNQLIPRKKASTEEEFIISGMANEEASIQPMAMEFCGINNVIPENGIQQKVTSNKSGNVSQPIQIVVSNEEEYKALMNSNHSIVFDDGDTNKTLTVLSTPHTTGINTAAIDLDNTSDDMMIIQENYPLAVSESLPGSNSNIVVVYSHAVDDQNKEYQLLTSQDIGEQFVQSSSVISQNYATITTTTPVINDMTTQSVETWQDNIQNDINQEVTVNELQEMEIDNQAEVNQNESIVESCVLPEVTLTPNISQITDQDPKLGIQSKDTENKIESTEQIVVEQVDNSVTAIDIERYDAEIENNTIIAASNEIIGPNVSNPQSNIQPTILDAEKQLIHSASIVEEGIEEHDTECEESPNESQIIETMENSEIVEETETVDNPEIAEETEDIVIQTAHNSNTAPTVLKEPIQTLASEWSEDDEDSQTAEPGQDNKTVTHKVAEVNTETTESPAEMEESIENIQQEMAKQITEVAQDDDTEKSAEETVEEQSADQKVTTKPQEKISSLLNDWDENDSQEEESLNADSASDVVNTDAVSQSKVSDENREITTKCDSAEDNSEQKNDDKIKSLVSDWDEEDENKS